MFDAETLKLIGQWGAWGIVFAAFVWLTRETVIKQSGTVAAIAENMKTIGSNMLSLQNRIETWNREAETAHSFQRKEHEAMIEVLERCKKIQ